MAASNHGKAHELAQDLDAKIDAFMDTLPRKPYTDGLTEENWREEIEKIPAFMTKTDDGATSTAIEALQALKYDEGTPEETALSYKDDGNDCFKKKKFKMASKAYSEGLKQNAKDDKLNAILYTNKAAAEYHLGNFRSSLNDAVKALELNPDHNKALLRCIQCCMKLELYSAAVQWCDRGLKEKPTDVTLQEYRLKADKAHKIFEKERRKRMIQEKKERAQKQRLLEAIKKRNIKLQNDEDEDNELLSEEDRMYATLQGSDNIVSLDEEGALIWPVRFMYPEHATTELIEAFNENASLQDHLEVMFGEDEFIEWDTEKKYDLNRLQVYFEDHNSQLLIKVNAHNTLKTILSDSRYRILAGTPAFIVLVGGSDYERKLLQKHNKRT
ncbi:tetratricopeptide repeat protein 4-like [Antedon mediterranea]|uniref:tetratricopeptide repeat protein 4-like n=1 Tax=Antedon mediterranea TaxID=105859 RepID=UPI003AF6F11A